MAENPKAVVDAIINEGKPSTISGGLQVHPVTIRRYAFLEKLNSPFLNPDVKFTVNSILPSLYVMTSENDVLKKYSTYNDSNMNKLIDDAYDWSDTADLSQIPMLIDRITSELLEMNKVSPTGDGSQSKKN